MDPQLFNEAKTLNEQVESLSKMENFLSNRATNHACLTLHCYTAKTQAQLSLSDIQAEVLLQLVRKQLEQSKADFINL